jgi:hypothetical protein
VGKCKDGHIPICTLDNKTNLLFHILDLLLHVEVLNQKGA